MSEAEIVTRRRKWTAEEKATLLAEVAAEGGRVSIVARRHGISDSLLYNWRSAWKAAVSMRSPEPVEFVPIGMIAQASDEGPAMMTVPEQPALPGSRREDRGGLIEIELANGVRLRVDALACWRQIHGILPRCRPPHLAARVWSPLEESLVHAVSQLSNFRAYPCCRTHD